MILTLLSNYDDSNQYSKLPANQCFVDRIVILLKALLLK